MSWLSKLFTGYNFVVDAVDRVSANYKKNIIFDTENREIIADGTVFVCHNNDEQEEVTIKDLVVKTDELQTQIEGLTAQLAEIHKVADLAKNSLDFYRNLAVGLQNQFEELKQKVEYQEGVCNRLLEDDKMDDQNMQNWEELVTETRERVLANEQSIIDWKESMNGMSAILVNNNKRIDELEELAKNSTAKKTKKTKQLLND